ncbi:hydroxycarboxylic acid receptor 2-like [Latimeria chalumnae]|uniref:hydroxycarboxylic acid receptor 2-like n=1 Tax=Latimeria chalumnae TaxID=7897 RepID=UPI0003C14082|nr:PREDICTED: hydroxycarboxylic acid receptor 2-like [Latimeria chalumnae]|eukprot:XP_005989080.1 PREDICTED: hydroxycarboxylic acid receptor 2-like [Latimeria chalumnae]
MKNTSCCVFEEPLLDSVLPPVLIVEFVLGLAGNGVGLWMFCFHMKNWKPNSVYLLNLAVADFVVLFCLLFRTDYYLRKKNWVYGDIPCRVLLFMLAANRASGTIFLTVVAIDRYFKIVHPHHRLNWISIKDSVLIACGLWVIIISMTMYLLAKPHLFPYSNLTQCESFNICPATDSSANWHEAYYISQFLIPVCIIAYCTVRITWQLKSKTIDKQGKIRKAVQFVLAVAIVFTVCFCPSNMVRIAIWFIKSQYSHDCKHFREANLAFYTSVCFTYFNSLLNPIVYYFSSPTFNGMFKNIFHRLNCKSEGKNAEDNTESVMATTESTT